MTAAAQFGLLPSDFAEPPFEVWPDNWQSVTLFDALGTQWRVGFGGPYGLDYGVLYRKMDRMGLSASQYDDIEADIRVLETAALEVMHEE